MAAPMAWHPLVPSSTAQGLHPVAARAAGRDLVVWRSASGVAQVWADRCPHRGVRLSLGRITRDRLACAYHGWEYAADSGRCTIIPAMPDMPVPGRVCARTYAAQEHQGMVWVTLDGTGEHTTAAAQFADTGPAPHRFCQSLAIRHPHPGFLQEALGRHGSLTHPHGWQGSLAGHAVHAFVLQADDHWSVLHLWCAADASNDALRAILAAARRLRSDLQTHLA